MNKYTLLLSLLIAFCLVGGSVKGQTIPDTKRLIAFQDTALENIFQSYLKVIDSVSLANNLAIVYSQMDSAQRYIEISRIALEDRDMDKCIEAIHRANYFIVNNQKRMHMPYKD